jgi:hypothetical protein
MPADGFHPAEITTLMTHFAAQGFTARQQHVFHSGGVRHYVQQSECRLRRTMGDQVLGL